MLKRCFVLCLAMGVLAIPVRVASHCELPCGIYHDDLRFEMLAEDIETITKSMNEINSISAADDKNYNQLVRWVINKEEHAEKFIHIIEQYFMHQRIKPVDPSDTDKYQAYLNLVELCHRMVVEAMKCTQTTDLQHVTNLTNLLEQFKQAYNA
jgi:nickel superoxide dismutase